MQNDRMDALFRDKLQKLHTFAGDGMQIRDRARFIFKQFSSESASRWLTLLVEAMLLSLIEEKSQGYLIELLMK